MKYSLGTVTVDDKLSGEKKDVPLLSVDNSDQYGGYFIDEINNLSVEYLQEIVLELDNLLCEKTDNYDFGFEVYIFDCTKDECRVLNTFEDWKEECVLPTKEIYKLLRDWRDYLIDFEQSK